MALGKLPAQPARPHLKLACLSVTLPDPPASVDRYSDVGFWPMYDNDRYGDCVEAGLGHHEQQISRYGQGVTVTVPDAAVLAAYTAITGFDPRDPNTDQGTVVQDALSWWRKGFGLAGHTITAYAAVDLASPIEIKQAMAIFGAVGIGFAFPAYAMGEFNAGKPWEVQRANAKIQGGHYVLAVGYDPSYVYTITWGATQRMSWAFFRKYVDEAWVVIDDEMISALSQYGTDLPAFGRQFADLTGQENPFQDVPTPPVTAAQVAAEVRATLDRLGV